MKRDAYYEFLDIASGAYGRVVRARRSTDHKFVAIKEMVISPTDEEAQHIQTLRNEEIAILKTLKGHANVIELIESDEKRIVMPYVRYNLRQLLNDQREYSKWPRSRVKGYLQQILRGVSYCHSKGIVHCDLKPENILVSMSNVVKIADFGIACSYVGAQSMRNPVISIWYRPLEIFYGSRKYGSEIDMWSMGCIMGELLQGTPLMPGPTDDAQLHLIYSLCGVPRGLASSMLPTQVYTDRNLDKTLRVDNKMRQRIRFFSGDAINLLDHLLDLNPKTRMSANNALRHVYFEEDVMNAEDMPHLINK